MTNSNLFAPSGFGVAGQAFEWAAPIREMVKQKWPLVPFRFKEDGYIFHGFTTGLRQGLLTGVFDNGERPHRRDLLRDPEWEYLDGHKVYHVSHELKDAAMYAN